MIAYLNGEYLPAEEARISIHDRGFLYADGVFETALLYHGGWFRLLPHLQRFRESAQAMQLAAPPTGELAAIAAELARRNGLRDGSLRVTLTRGSAGRPTLVATLSPPDPRWVEKARLGWTLITAHTRRPSTASVPAQLKALGRSYALLARHEAEIAGADDALLLTDDGFICEGPAWTIFWRRGSELFTPALDLGVLAGITRTVLLEIAPGLGFRTAEGAYPRAELDTADEVFATMTSVGLVSVRALDGCALPEATPAADRLRPAYWERVANEVASAE